MIKTLKLTEIAESLCADFFRSLDDLFEVELNHKTIECCTESTFLPRGNCIAEVGYIGSVAGFMSICADESVLSQCFGETGEIPTDEEERENFRAQINGPLKEIINTCAGKCLKKLLAIYPVITMQTPKIIYGSVSFPKVMCVRHSVKCDAGNVHFYISMDAMRLDITRIVEELETSEKKNQQVIKSLGILYANLEQTQSGLLSEVGATIGKIEALQTLVASNDNDQGEKFKLDIQSVATALSSTREHMNRHLGNTIHDLRIFKNRLLDQLLVTKIWKDADHLEVSLAGYLNENANLSFFLEKKSGLLTVNTKNLFNFNASGAQIWISFLGRIPQAVDISYQECSAEFLEFFQTNERFMNRFHIDSIASYYTCRQCRYTDEVIIHTDFDDMQNAHLPKVLCSCGQTMELGENAEIIADFISKLALRPISPQQEESKRAH